jgi:hypothetical protein
MRRRPIAVIAAVGAVAALGSGASLAAGGTPPADTALLVGRYQDGQQIALTNLTVPDGSYAVAYGAEVQFFARGSRAVLQCGLVDASGRIGYLDDAVFPVPGTGAWTRIGDTAVYDVPEITLGIRCSPSEAGSFAIGYRGVSLKAMPAG